MSTSDFKKLKKGQLVKFTKAHLQWLKAHAFEMHTTAGGIAERHLESYVLDRMVIMGYPCKVKLLQKLADVGSGAPGGRFLVSIPCGLQRVVILNHKDVR